MIRKTISSPHRFAMRVARLSRLQSLILRSGMTLKGGVIIISLAASSARERGYSLRIDGLGGSEYLFTANVVPACFDGGALNQFHLPPAEQARQLRLHAGHAQKPRRAARLELDQHVDVAIGSEVLTQCRPRKWRTASRRASGKIRGEPLFGDGYLRVHSFILITMGSLLDDKTNRLGETNRGVEPE